MSCISVHIARSDAISVAVRRPDAIGISASRMEAMQVHISVVCDLATEYYLLVAPAKLWVTDWDNEIVDVKSNTKWKVE